MTHEAIGRRVSGKKVVLGMFLFGIILTGILWIYWYYHSAPFADLQRAIGTEFKHSSPRVDGGQRRMHLGGPRLLWIILRIPFEPVSDPDRSQTTANRVLELVRQHSQVNDFDKVNIRLFYGEPERVLHRQDFEVILKPTQGTETIDGSAKPRPVSKAE